MLFEVLYEILTPTDYGINDLPCDLLVKEKLTALLIAIGAILTLIAIQPDDQDHDHRDEAEGQTAQGIDRITHGIEIADKSFL